MPAMFDLLCNVDIWIDISGASNDTTPYKEGCIKMRADKGGREIFLKAVQSKHVMDISGTVCDKYGNQVLQTMLERVV